MASIGELFVNLGIKGADQTVGALTNVRKGLQNLSSMSLEAKAGILGALYGLQRLTAASGQVGTSLTNFTALTGQSARQLQQWQYAARQAGISGEEMSGSVKSVQNAMANMLLGKGAPEGLGLVAQAAGGIDSKKLQDPFYMLQKLQVAAQRLNPAIGNVALKSFGLSEGVIAAMRRGVFRPSILNRAPTYTDNEIQQLNKANVAWANLGNTIEMAIGRWNAAHGPKLVDDISKLVPKVLDLANAFVKLADTLKIFEGISKAIEGWTMIFGGASSVVSNFAEGVKNPAKMNQIGGQYNDFISAIPGALKLMLDDIRGVGPKPSQNITINQNLNFQHDGKDHVKTSNSVKKSVNDAVRQMTSQGQGS